MICDLRSDALGPLSAEVMEAFQRAASRPPGFGRLDDAEERALCRDAAELFGFEDALFLPTGTLANQIAVRLWVQPGQAIVATADRILRPTRRRPLRGSMVRSCDRWTACRDIRRPTRLKRASCCGPDRPRNASRISSG